MSWLGKLKSGLSKTVEALGLSRFKALGEADYEAIEDLLIEADLGPELAMKFVSDIRKKNINSADENALSEALASSIETVLAVREGRFSLPKVSGPRIVLFVGVNGSGKTTTLGKIAHRLKADHQKILIVAGDTCRAAAVEQLKVWAERADCDFLSRPAGSDAASLVHEAMQKAADEAYDTVLIDTAGRLQNKTQLMDELLKIVRTIRRFDPEAPHETLLVLDATVGRNALSQEQIFGRTALVSGLVMTKLDGTSRGGVLVPIAKASDAPIKLIGVGEGIEDLQDFNARAFARTMVGLDT
jgi:fused signal recognition particle receptor